MDIRCENCAAEHSLSPPPWVLSSGRPFRFRCSSCGHSQMVAPDAPAPVTQQPDGEEPPSTQTAAPPRAHDQRTIVPDVDDDEDSLVSPRIPTPPPAPERASSQPPPTDDDDDQSIYLKQDGKVYRVKDWPTLQRWVVERRVGREDLVSKDGIRWQPVGSRDDLQSFFQVVDQLEAAELAALQKPAGTPLGVGRETPFVDEKQQGPALGQPTAAGSDMLVDDDDDDDLLGVPTGLPPLPTEEVSAVVARDAIAASPPADEPVVVEDDGEDIPAAFAEEEEDVFAEDEDDEEEEEIAEGEVSFADDDDDLFPTSDSPFAPEEAAAESENVAEEGTDALFIFPPLEEDAPTQLGSEPDPEGAATEKLDWDIDTIRDQQEGGVPKATPPPPPDSLRTVKPSEPKPVSQAPSTYFEGEDDEIDHEAPTVLEDPPEQVDEESPFEDINPAAEQEDSLGDSLGEDFREFDAMSTESTPMLDDDDPLEEWNSRRGMPSWALPLAGLLTLGLVLGGGYLWYVNNMTRSGGATGPTVQDALEGTEPPSLQEALPAEPATPEAGAATEEGTAEDAATEAGDATEAVSPEAPATKPATPEPATPEPEPEPARSKPAASPAPAASGGSVQQRIDRGWSVADRGDLSGAAAVFKQAVDQAPNNPEALFGYGYTLLEGGNTDGGRRHLCRALDNATEVGLKREVNGILAGRGLSCK